MDKVESLQCQNNGTHPLVEGVPQRVQMAAGPAVRQAYLHISVGPLFYPCSAFSLIFLWILMEQRYVIRHIVLFPFLAKLKQLS